MTVSRITPGFVDSRGPQLGSVTKTPKQSQSFSELMQDKRVIAELDGFSENWNNAMQQQLQQIKQLPSETKNLVELQLTVNRLHLQSLLVTKAGETFSGTLRQMQQMGSS